MNDRELGNIQARLDAMEESLRELRGDVKKLLNFRGWVLGISAVVAALVSWLTGGSTK